MQEAGNQAVFEATDLLMLRQLLEQGEKEEVDDFLEGFYPIDMATTMEALEDHDLLFLSNHLDLEDFAAIFEQAQDLLQQRLIKILPKERIVGMFAHMANDDVADVLQDLPLGRRKNFLKEMKNQQSQIVASLLDYPADSAGGLMTTRYVAVREHLTVSETLEKIRHLALQTEVIETIFVVNRAYILVGTLDLRDVLRNKGDVVVSDLMWESGIRVLPDVDQESVSQLVERYDLNVVPVVNEQGNLLGIITLDDVVDVIVEEHLEDVLYLGGVSKEESTRTTLITSIKQRLPWLVVNLATALLASSVIGLFEGLIVQISALAVIMPIVSGMGGNAGTQTLAVMIRSITLHEVSWEDNRNLVWKEILLGICNGAVCGSIAGFLLFLVYGNPFLGLILCAAMVLNLAVACCFGYLIPLFLKFVGQDPALASSIFLTTVTDVFGFFIFLGLAQLFLPLLI
ncbi:MAG: magnesium transporter [Erysipelotrichaceae bacterium]